MGRALYNAAWVRSLREAVHSNEPAVVRHTWSNWYIRTALHVVLLAPCLVAHQEGLLRPAERRRQAVVTCLLVAAIELLAEDRGARGEGSQAGRSKVGRGPARLCSQGR